MKLYNVIWFDDEHETLEIIKDEAAKEGIILHGFTNAEDGLKYLEKNIASYNAIIVDGKFYKNANQSGDTVSDSALFSVARFLDKIENNHKLPWFILSGQPSFIDEVNTIALEFKENKVYNKNFDTDLDKLWIDLKLEANQQLNTQIKHNYAKVFEVCSDKYIGEESANTILRILKGLYQMDMNFDAELHFTPIRIVLENMFRAANKYGLLHDLCVKGGKVNLSESSLFMSGEETKHLGIKAKESVFNKIISNNVKSLLFITGAASHTVIDDPKKNIDLMDYKSKIKTPFLLQSLTLQLLDVLVWFKNYVDSNPDTEKNKLNWVYSQQLSNKKEVSSWQTGTVINLNKERGFAFFKPFSGSNNTIIPPSLVSLHSIVNEMEIEVQIEEYLEANITKTRVKELKKLS